MTKDTAPPCGLYLKLAASMPTENALRFIRQAAFVINRSAYEQNMHAFEIDPSGAADDLTATLVQLIQAQGLVAILRSPAQLAQDLGADGVILTDASQIAEARRILGDEKIIGLSCELGRTEAEAALALDIDYVILADPALIGWWAGQSEHPCVATGSITNDTTAHYVRAGAGFIECSNYVWTHEKGTIQAITDMLYAIDLAAESKKAALN